MSRSCVPPRPQCLLMLLLLMLLLLVPSTRALPQGWSVDYIVPIPPLLPSYLPYLVLHFCPPLQNTALPVAALLRFTQANDVVVFNTGTGMRAMHFHAGGKASRPQHRTICE